MTWQSPLGWLALAAVPVILWVHRQRRRATDAVVPSIVPWLVLRFAEPMRRRRVPPSVLLALHLACAALLAVALAGPQIRGRPAPSGDVALVVDTTASMGAGDRWPAARAALADASSRVGGRLSVIAMGASPRVLVARGQGVATVLAAFDAVSPGDVGADVEGALALAGAVAGQGARAVVITDGALEASAGPSGGGAEAAAAAVEWRVVGGDQPMENLAVIDAEAAAEAVTGSAGVFARVANLSAEPVRARVTLSMGTRVLDRAPVALGPWSKIPLAWRLDHQEGVVDVTVERLDAAGEPAPDGLGLDDVARVPLAARERRVQAAGASSATRRALNAQSATRLSDVGIGTLADDGMIDVTVIQGLGPATLPLGGALLVDPPSGPWLPESGAAITGTWTAGVPHPITAGLDLSEASIAGVTGRRAPPWATVLGRVAGRPAAWAGTVEGRRVVVLAFDPERGSLADRVAFPLLIGRALDWAAPDMPPATLKPGAPFPLPPWPVAITAPDGRRTLAADRFDDTALPGLYTVRRSIVPRVGAVERGDWVSVQAGDATESRLLARTPKALSDAFTPEAGARPPDGSAPGPPDVAPVEPMQRFPLLAALVLLAVEAGWRALPAGRPALGRGRTS